MRQLQIRARAEHVERILDLARDHESLPPSVLRARKPADDGALEEGWALILAEIPNRGVGGFFDAVDAEFEDVSFVLLPEGTLPLQTPIGEVAERVRDVSRVSTVELVLSSLQSVGSWKGMMLYSVLTGVIGAYGVVFDVSYLLVAAMLINPMGAPALVSVIGLTIGDLRIFGRGGVRFLVSLVIQGSAAMALGFGYGLDFSTDMMEQITSLSAWAVLVAAAAGAAGAQTLVNSERDSLVSGTAAGFMVAAALAPPTAVLGLSIPLQRWDYAALISFLLLLQFVAIGLGGWVALTLFGVRPSDSSAGRGSPARRTAMLVSLVLLTAGLVWWQTQQEPRFLKADLSRHALQIARDAVEAVPGAHMVQSRAHFTRVDLGRYDREGLLIEIVVERNGDEADDGALSAAIREEVRGRVGRRMEGVVPFVDVVVLPGLGASP
jgi:uncharacterized membrane protein